MRWALVGLLMLLVVPAASGAAPPRIALVIGNGGYTGTAPPLANPPADARLMTRALEASGFEVFELIDADQRQMRNAIREFGIRLDDAGDDAVGLFYYAGHGVQVGGANYLIPVGAHIEREPDVKVEAVDADSVLGEMNFAGNRLNFVILDACRNNPYAGTFRSASRGLSEMKEVVAKGVLIAYSTGPGEVALDGDTGNSPYTVALTEAMAQPGLAVETLFKRVRENVLEETGDLQRPWESNSIVGDFFFRPGANVANVVIPPIVERGPSETAEIAFWESIKDSGNRAAYQAYLDQFPAGVFAALARIEIDAIDNAGGDADRGEGTQVAARAAEQTTAGAVDRRTAETEANRTEEMFWRSAVDGGTATDFEAYLKQYPNGAFAALAEIRLDELRGAQTAALPRPRTPDAKPQAPEREAQVASGTAGAGARGASGQREQALARYLSARRGAARRGNLAGDGGDRSGRAG